MAESFVGKFKLIDSRYFDDYMKALGVNAITRALANNTTPTLEFSVDSDGTWTFRTLSTVKNTEVKFKLGQEFEETSIDGRKCKTIVTLENGKMVQRQKAIKSNERDTVVIREVKGDDLVVEMLLDNVVCVRTHRRQ